jgi:3-hydroxymyristoyl/3-hydroxydecanoyl-(acyl carrier protein) dehydratase
MDELFDIVANSEHSHTIKLASHTHPVFKAHFEGNPILPAFTQVDITAKLLEFDIIGIVKSKFMMPLLPEMLIDIIVESKDKVNGEARENSLGWKICKAKWLVDGKTASEMTLEIA